MKILKNNKELQVAANAHIGYDIKVKNARGKKSSKLSVETPSFRVERKQK